MIETETNPSRCLKRLVMPSRPKALDLFCGAGGAGMGLYRAGFDVTGVDIKQQRRYPFWFMLGDALEADLSGFDFVWASPPCQRYTVSQNASRNREAHPDLIAPVRAKLEAWGGPWIIENVVGAPLCNPTMLCGLALGLKVKRHRLFESNCFLLGLPCGGHDQDYYLLQGREVRNRVRMGADPKGTRCGLRVATSIGREAMGIDWMTRAEMSEAIPPAYAEFLGRQIIRCLPARHNEKLKHSGE
jgi:DNA (cytosine-5)-methyltransferase 1